MYHLKGSPADPNRIYASQTSGWFGQIIQRSDDGGKTWHQPGTPPGEPTTTPDGMPKGESNKFVYDTSPETGKPLTTHQYYDGTQRPWEFKRVWHLEPSLTDPDTVYAGIEDAALFRSSDGGQTWQELAGLRDVKGSLWQPGAGGMCLHTIVLDPSNPQRIYIAISAAGAFRTDDGGKTWRPINRGLKSQYELPDPDAEVGHCVHRIAMHPSRPNVLFMQKHWDVMRSDDAGESWHEISGNLPTDFGFPIDVHAHEPETIYVVPIKSDSEHFPPDGKVARVPEPDGRERVGSAHERSAAARLLCERVARRDGRRLARSVRRLFRDDRRASVWLGRCRRQLDADRPGSSGGVIGRGPDVVMTALKMAVQRAFSLRKPSLRRTPEADASRLACFALRPCRKGHFEQPRVKAAITTPKETMT